MKGYDKKSLLSKLKICLSALSYDVLPSKPRNWGKGGRWDHCPQGTSHGPTQGRSPTSLARAGVKLRQGEDSGADYSA